MESNVRGDIINYPKYQPFMTSYDSYSKAIKFQYDIETAIANKQNVSDLVKDK